MQRLFWGSLLAMGICLTPLTVPVLIEGSMAQIQNSQSEELLQLIKLGGQQTQQGQPQQAIETFQQALAMARQLKVRKVEAVALLGIGSNYGNIGQPQQALDYYNQALPIFREVRARSGEATTLNNIGAVYRVIGQPQKALEFFNSALPISREVRARSQEATTLSNIGFVYRDTNQPTSAITNLSQSVEIILQIRGGLQRSNRQNFLHHSGTRAIALVDLLIDQKQPERAYEWVNLSTTADLADYSRLINAKVANPEAQQQIDQWNQKNQLLSSLRQQLQNRFDANLSRRINELQASVNQQAEAISRRFPEVAELFETTTTDIAQLRANIPTGTVIIHPVLLTQVSHVPNTIAIFVLTKTKITVIKQAINPQEFDTLLTQYRAELTNKISQGYKVNSQKLYDILIRPVSAEIKAASPTQLSIIATGKLRYIPFETLYDRETKQFLIQKYPVNNLTRLSSHSLQTVGTIHQPLQGLLALGNPFPNDNRNLPGAELEIASIKKLLPSSEVDIHSKATLNTFKTQAPRFGFLHVATHGCFKASGCPDLNLKSNTLLFADQSLDIADAALLGLKNTNLITLSACETAVSANSNGEEIAGIAYLFERAGAKAVIASLWSVSDDSTNELMIHFYNNLKQGMSKGEALRRAKLSLINLNPYYWSPFILIGDAS